MVNIWAFLLVFLVAAKEIGSLRSAPTIISVQPVSNVAPMPSDWSRDSGSEAANPSWRSLSLLDDESLDTDLLSDTGGNPDDVTLWQQGRGPFPYLSSRYLTEEELIEGLYQYENEDKPEMGAIFALSLLLDGISRNGFFGCVETMRQKFHQSSDPEEKLTLTSYLVEFADFTGVDYARRVYQKSDAFSERDHASWILAKVLPIQELEFLAAQEKSPKIVAFLRDGVECRNSCEVSFQEKFGRSVRAMDMETLEEQLRTRPVRSWAIAAPEIYRRRFGSK